jgi:hypothetical protein
MQYGFGANVKRAAPLPRKTSCTAQVALQRFLILRMSKRKRMVA